MCEPNNAKIERTENDEAAQSGGSCRRAAEDLR
jgi:hypothetical protein